MKKIAVGIDFSRESELAARQAVEIARHTGAAVILVHTALTVELPPVGPDPEAQVRAALDTVRSRLARELDIARERLAALRVELSGQGPDVSQVLSEGLADEALSSAARDLDVDLMVLGTHGRTGLRWFLLGSVAQKVVRLADCDVLVARRDGSGRGGYRRILVATDFSPASVRALDRALDLAAPDAEVAVLHCHQWPVVDWGYGTLAATPALDADLAGALRQQGEKLVAARRRAGGPKLDFEIVFEPATLGIVHQLESRPFDLAILGSHGRRGFRRAVLGSVAEAVVRRAPCSVLVARATS